MQAVQEEAAGVRDERDRTQQELKRFKDMTGQVQRKVSDTRSVVLHVPILSVNCHVKGHWNSADRIPAWLQTGVQHQKWGGSD